MNATFTVGDEYTIAATNGERYTGTVVENTTRIIALVTPDGNRVEIYKGRIRYNDSYAAGRQRVVKAARGDGRTIHRLREGIGFTYCGLGNDRIRVVEVADVNRHVQCKKCFPRVEGAN